MITCRYCAASDADANVKFCKKCGAPLGETKAAVPAVPASNSAGGKAMTIIGFIISLFCSLWYIISTLMPFTSYPPEDPPSPIVLIAYIIPLLDFLPFVASTVSLLLCILGIKKHLTAA